MRMVAEPVERLIQELSRLPGVGQKTAARLAFWLLQSSSEQANALADAIREVKEKITLCPQCYNYMTSDSDLCAICSSAARDKSLVCVVEEPLDIRAIERTHEFKGLYHVLHGRLSPLDGIGPEKLKLRELQSRAKGGEIKEVIIATNPTIEGSNTAHFIQNMLKPHNIRVTRLAYGLPMGGDLEYADEVTLSRALQGRQVM